jgi:hypothetical protein
VRHCRRNYRQLESLDLKKSRHAMSFLLRPATPQDIPHLRELIDSSVRALQSNDYTPTQIEAALHSVYGVDTQLIADGTYFAVEHVGVREGLREGLREDDDPAAPSAPFTNHCSSSL